MAAVEEQTYVQTKKLGCELCAEWLAGEPQSKDVATKQEVATLRAEVNGLRAGMATLQGIVQGELRGILQGVAALHGEVATLRGEVGSVGEMGAWSNLHDGVTALQGEVATLRAAGLSSDGEIRDLVEERHREVLQKLEEAIAELNKATATPGAAAKGNAADRKGQRPYYYWGGAQGWDTDEGSVAQGRAADSRGNCWQRRSGGAQGWGTDGGSAHEGRADSWEDRGTNGGSADEGRADSWEYWGTDGGSVDEGRADSREDCCWQGRSGGAQGWGTNAEGNVDRGDGGWSSGHWGGEPASGRRRGGPRSDVQER